MTVFLILATLLVAGALLLVIPPVLGLGQRVKAQAQRQRQAETVLVVLREQLADLETEHASGHLTEAEYQRAREEVEARALEEGRVADAGTDLRPSVKWAIAIALVTPVLATSFYLWLGEPRGLEPVQAAKEEGHQITPEQMIGLVAQLADRLEREPGDLQGWLMLGRSYAMMQDFPSAVASWKRLGSKIPDHPDVLADWADLLAGAAGRKFSGDPDRLINRALELDPVHVKALALAGTSAFQRQDFAGASALWERILVNVPPSEDMYRAIVGSINDARTRGGLPLFEGPKSVAAPAPTSPIAGTPAVAQATAGASQEVLKLSGRVSLAPELQAKSSADDSVFVFVRPPQGGMPIAALRFRAADLPASFDFTNAPRMSQGPLPAQISVGARLSKQGSASAQAGDLEGAAVAVTPDASGVEVLIDRVRQ